MVASPLERTRHTAWAIRRRHPGASYTEDRRLAEQYGGLLQGQRPSGGSALQAHMAAMHAAWSAGDKAAGYPGGESPADLTARALPALREAAALGEHVLARPLRCCCQLFPGCLLLCLFGALCWCHVLTISAAAAAVPRLPAALLAWCTVLVLYVGDFRCCQLFPGCLLLCLLGACPVHAQRRRLPAALPLPALKAARCPAADCAGQVVTHGGVLSALVWELSGAASPDGFPKPTNCCVTTATLDRATGQWTLGNIFEDVIGEAALEDRG